MLLLNDIHGVLEQANEHRYTLSQEMRASREQQDRILNRVGSYVNQFGDSLVRWGERLQARAHTPELRNQM